MPLRPSGKSLAHNSCQPAVVGWRFATPSPSLPVVGRSARHAIAPAADASPREAGLRPACLLGLAPVTVLCAHTGIVPPDTVRPAAITELNRQGAEFADLVPVLDLLPRRAHAGLVPRNSRNQRHCKPPPASSPSMTMSPSRPLNPERWRSSPLSRRASAAQPSTVRQWSSDETVSVDA